MMDKREVFKEDAYFKNFIAFSEEVIQEDEAELRDPGTPRSSLSMFVRSGWSRYRYCLRQAMNLFSVL